MYYNQSEQNLVKAQRHTAGLRHGKNQCNSAIFWQDSVYNHLVKKNNKIMLLCVCMRNNGRIPVTEVEEAAAVILKT